MSMIPLKQRTRTTELSQAIDYIHKRDEIVKRSRTRLDEMLKRIESLNNQSYIDLNGNLRVRQK